MVQERKLIFGQCLLTTRNGQATKRNVEKQEWNVFFGLMNQGKGKGVYVQPCAMGLRYHLSYHVRGVAHKKIRIIRPGRGVHLTTGWYGLRKCRARQPRDELTPCVVSMERSKVLNGIQAAGPSAGHLWSASRSWGSVNLTNKASNQNL